VTGDSSALHRDLEERNVDLLIARIFKPVYQDHFDVETLCEDPYAVVAGIRNPWTRRRRVTLADIVDEPWVLPSADSLVGSFVVEAFRASGLHLPRATVVAFPVELRNSLLETGRFLTILPRSILRFPAIRSSRSCRSRCRRRAGRWNIHVEDPRAHPAAAFHRLRRRGREAVVKG
jgi:DNA-binding transcriptional LysR family regulator